MGAIYRRIGKTHGTSTAQAFHSLPGQGLMKTMADADCSAKIRGSCGESMEIYLKVDEELITDAGFVADGCLFSIICGYLATQLAKGMTIDEAAQIEGDTILAVFKEVPEGESHCAYLAAETLHAAIHNWMLK
ncbi:iron-sulfur cluster assembly scaffold protein [Desulfoferrobacter suflitae]|uniref:iron-sulfur cluster assembly scaffold protein n=1 Tax=Desulfoferrobacter suflitae TaxID=2865782 RepID=UPI00216461F2|nr:iron-sulfur cluster assembly scaffold protein [Desulfoferrobacter suflitae]MCK8603575.1 iron-sulfur cluster assembly scaffold protein [Desulfoferrobacter suflitae]